MPFLLTVLGFGKAAMNALFNWLSSLSLCQICGILLALYGAAYTIAYKAEKRHCEKVQVQLNKEIALLKVQLNAISSVKNVQKVVTQNRIQTVVKTIHDADQRAKQVESAPPAPDCKTNSAVLGADL